MKRPPLLLSFAAAGLLAGCTLTSPGGRAVADPLTLAHLFEEPGGGFGYEGFCKELHIKPKMFVRGEDDLPLAMEVVPLHAVGTNLWRMAVVNNGWKSEWQYLIFSREDRSWRFIGHIDVPAQPYVEPDRRIERAADGRTWLVLTYVTCWGTEVYDRKEAWYSLGQRDVKLQRQVALANEE